MSTITKGSSASDANPFAFSPLSTNPRVGVGVFILSPYQPSPSNPRFLMGRRLGSHGANTWALPGGHLEFGESFEECAARECLEETGLAVTATEFLTATNDVMAAEGRHYVTVFMVARLEGKGEKELGEREADQRDEQAVDVRVMEPDKCAEWQWVDWEQLVGSVQGQEQIKKGAAEGMVLFGPMVELVRSRSHAVPGLRASGPGTLGPV